jgi:hypothetical protein
MTATTTAAPPSQGALDVILLADLMPAAEKLADTIDGLGDRCPQRLRELMGAYANAIEYLADRVWPDPDAHYAT